MANPLLFFIVATELAEEVHLAVVVRFWVVPLLKVPVAVNCCVLPGAMEGESGVTAIETSGGAVPLPVRATTCGLEAPLSTMVRVPLRIPMALGLKVTEISHAAPGARVAGLTGQLLVAE